MTQTKITLNDINGNIGSSQTFTSVEVDFGAFPVKSKKFIITGTTANTNSKIFAVASSANAAGRPSGDLEMDNLVCSAHCSSNTNITLNITAIPGPIIGKRVIIYSLG
jgi:hypothetical protein